MCDALESWTLDYVYIFHTTQIYGVFFLMVNIYITIFWCITQKQVAAQSATLYELQEIPAVVPKVQVRFDHYIFWQICILGPAPTR